MLTKQQPLVNGLRELADSIERGEEVNAMIVYATKDGRIAYASIGNGLIVDGLAMHVLRVSIQHGAAEITDGAHG